MPTSFDERAATAERYRAFAEVEARGMSPCYEEWAAGVAADASTLELIDGLPPAKRQPPLVFASARFRGAPVSPYPEFRAWLHEHWADVRETALTHATQTNEAARCAVLLPLLQSLPQPLALIEVGASAGLCLYPDRYSYRYATADGGELRVDPVDGPSDVLLECEASAPLPAIAAPPEIAWRAGIDLHPLDLRDADDLAWLDALIWPEHDDRRARLRAAAAIAAADPPRLVAGDLNERLAALAAEAPVDATLVVFHTVVLAYASEADRLRFEEQVSLLPGHWVSFEGRSIMPGISAREDVPNDGTDFVLALDGVQVAWAHPHGRGIRWFGPDRR
ncbi:DUF2332 family protein [Agromyces sp. MMS24-JH15]|uniref:DUF2332 family protein n=1 Tax=Agromyces sp. MMS24-JH15 TaxID=3243765 RepID=UPI003747F153